MISMNVAKATAHMNNSSMSNVKPVNEIAAVRPPKQKEKTETLEFKLTPSLDKISKSEESLTGTYNSKGKLALISNKMIVYVQPSAYIRDKLVPSYKAVI
jgi:hypothetical protein